MRQAGASYQQEENRLRGAKPRVKAVLYPFELDCGLAPDAGVFEHTAYGGEPGRLEMEAGYYASGSWTSPVMQTFSPFLDHLVPDWEEPAGAMDAEVSLRSAETAAQVAGAPYASLVRQTEIALAPFFQVRVEFRLNLRCGAVDAPEDADEYTAYAVDLAPDQGYESYGGDGETPGYLAGLVLYGRLTLPEREILDPGSVRLDLARDFGEFRAGDHVLTMDNRRGQWLPGGEDSYLLGLGHPGNNLALYQGWELADATVDWQLVYQGVVDRVGGLAHGWRAAHRALLETQEAIAVRLRQPLGNPSPQGERRPFLRGVYRAQAELVGVTPVSLSQPAKSGSGAAILKVLGDFRGDYPQEYLIEISSSGEVGAAMFRWSLNQGQSWEKTGLPAGGAEAPMDLSQGLAVYWEPAAGTDLVSGDRWSFTAAPAIYQYQVYGAPFQDITAVYLNYEEAEDRVEANAASGLIQIIGRSGQVEARVVKDNLRHPVDIITEILEEMGLGSSIHLDSFALAKSLAPEYAIGVCFENITAAQAIREIVKRCLYDLWVDFGEIKIRAYLGD